MTSSRKPGTTALFFSVLAVGFLALDLGVSGAAAQDAAKAREECVGILCGLIDGTHRSGGAESASRDQLTMPKTGLLGTLFSGDDAAPAGAPPATPPAAAAPEALPDAAPEADAPIIKDRTATRAAASPRRSRCAATGGRDPWECYR